MNIAIHRQQHNSSQIKSGVSKDCQETLEGKEKYRLWTDKEKSVPGESLTGGHEEGV